MFDSSILIDDLRTGKHAGRIYELEDLARSQPRSPSKNLIGMKTNLPFSALFLGLVLASAPAVAFSLQASASQDSGAKQDMKNAGHDTKNAATEAGHGVKQGTKKAYHSTKSGTKKAYHSTKSGTKKAWNKTKSTTKGAVNGGKEGAKQPQ